MADYYLRFDANNKPLRLLKSTTGGGVAVWDGQEWNQTELTIMQLDGLGGSADYRRFRKPADHKPWLTRLGNG